MYITVPVKKGAYGQLICDVETSSHNANWKNKHFRSIEQNYSKAPYFSRYRDFLHDIYTKNWEKLMDINIYIIEFLLKELCIETKTVVDADLNAKGSKSQLLISICKELGCNTYISNLGSKAYIQVDEFAREGIDHIYINYVGKPYKQRYEGFEANLSTLDLLMNCGPDVTKAMIADKANYYISEINEVLL